MGNAADNEHGEVVFRACGGCHHERADATGPDLHGVVGRKAGDTIFVSGAAGAVGSAAGQLAKQRGCRVIGSAGSPAKVELAQRECGFDVAFDYKAGPILEHLQRAAPEGIDVYFDNVGGEMLEAALTVLRPHGRIIGCGSISRYNDEQPSPGPSNLMNIVTKRLTWKGFIVGDFLPQRAEFEREVGGYLRAGKLKNHETRVTGLEQTIPAFIGLFHGNTRARWSSSSTDTRRSDHISTYSG